MKLRSALLLILVWASQPLAAYALQNTITYSRTHIAIIRKNPPMIKQLPWLTAPAPAEDPALAFDVEVRDAATLYNQQGWFNMSDFSANNGLLLVFNKPQIAPIRRMTQYAPMDILLIDSQGTITQIIPNIKLSELDNEIVPASSVLAFLFIRGGVCAEKSINPGDKIDYNVFRQPPAIVSAPRPENMPKN